jgi:hypothetical protein
MGCGTGHHHAEIIHEQKILLFKRDFDDMSLNGSTERREP